MSSNRDENRPATLVAFLLVGAEPGAALTATERAVLAAVGLHGGRVIRADQEKVAEFSRPDQAFAFAVESLRMVSRYNERHAEAPLVARLGAHHDTVWFVGDDVIGDAPAVAVGLARGAEPGTVLASAAALSRLTSTAGWEIAERGKTRVVGVEAEIPVLQARPRPATLAGAERPTAAAAAPGAATVSGGVIPPVPPAAPVGPLTPGQEIMAGLTQIGRAVVNELAERSRGVTEEKVRQAMRGQGRPQQGYHYEYRGRWADEGGGELAAAGEELPADFLDQKKKRSAKRAGRAIAGFLSHATSFLVVGAGLVALNVVTGSSFPWAFFPVAGWGIGIVSHWQAVRSTRRRNRQLQVLESVSPEQLRLVEKIQNGISGFGGHAASFLAVNGFLAGINLITSSGYLWFLWPMVSWGIGFALHAVNHFARSRQLIRELKETGISWSDVQAGRTISGGHAVVAGPSRVTQGMEHYELVREARAIRDRLLSQISENSELGKRMGEDVTELLTTYSDQLEKLVLRNDEFRKTMASLPEGSIEQELQDYRNRIAGTEHVALRHEYEKALEQGERHLKSVQELKHQKEIMGLRIQSSFGLLRQLELDFVRLKNAENTGEVQGLRSIRTKSHEISDYLEGLDEADRTE